MNLSVLNGGGVDICVDISSSEIKSVRSKETVSGEAVQLDIIYFFMGGGGSGNGGSGF